MATFKIQMSYYDLSQCAGIELYYIPPAQRNKQQLHKDINAMLNKIGLKLTSKPYWLPVWEIVAIDGWSLPAEFLYKATPTFPAGYKAEIGHDYDVMPVHMFVDKYIGYLGKAVSRD